MLPRVVAVGEEEAMGLVAMVGLVDWLWGQRQMTRSCAELMRKGVCDAGLELRAIRVFRLLLTATAAVGRCVGFMHTGPWSIRAEKENRAVVS